MVVATRSAHRFLAAAAAALCGWVLAAPAPAAAPLVDGRVLQPAGRVTVVGDYPTGGAITPSGRFYWAIDSGHGRNDIQIVRVSDGVVVQVVPLPGAYGGVAFTKDGRRAYVSGEPSGFITAAGPVLAPGGEAVHVFDVDRTTGLAVERTPIQLPATSGGFAQQFGAKRGWPYGLDVSRDGTTLAVALNQADQLALVTLATGTIRLVPVGIYPARPDFTGDGTTVLVTNEYSGTVSFVDVASATVTATVGVGGPANPDGSANPNRNAHPTGIVIDDGRALAYVAVTNRDLIAVIDLATRSVQRYVSVADPAGYGTQPVDLALTTAGNSLFVAEAGRDTVSEIATEARRGAPEWSIVGRIPTASVPSAVDVSADSNTLVWLAARGTGSGPNPGYGEHFAAMESAPYDSYDLNLLIGRVGIMAMPSDKDVRALTPTAEAQDQPVDAGSPPAGTPVVGADGGASAQIKHVFFIVRENRTYDQVFGTDARGDGDPSLELLDDNGVAGPTGGVTPNAHALARRFPLLDHVFANSDVSNSGHKITTGAMAIDAMLRGIHQSYSGRGKLFDVNGDPSTAPPRDYLFDQAIRQQISFINYGETAAGTLASANDGRPTYAASAAARPSDYHSRMGCVALPVNDTNCGWDSGTPGHATGQDNPYSRFDAFEKHFDSQLATGTVPAFNYFVLPNDHTQGTTPGYPTPRALIADNDRGLGQIVDKISHSSVWASSAIFVVEDDSQDGGDHVDAHRIPAFVISPWARSGAVVSHRYDQQSVLRTMELILGMRPLSLFDGRAAPMYDAFVSGTQQPDMTPYGAIEPQYPRTAINPSTAPLAGLSAALPYDQLDSVPQQLNDAILWKSVKGAASKVPAPGPNASADEAARAVAALAAYRKHKPIPRGPDQDD